jgi:hypothetical protein
MRFSLQIPDHTQANLVSVYVIQCAELPTECTHRYGLQGSQSHECTPKIADGTRSQSIESPECNVVPGKSDEHAKALTSFTSPACSHGWGSITPPREQGTPHSEYVDSVSDDGDADAPTARRLCQGESWMDETLQTSSVEESYPPGPGKERGPICSPAAVGVGMDTLLTASSAKAPAKISLDPPEDCTANARPCLEQGAIVQSACSPQSRAHDVSPTHASHSFSSTTSSPYTSSSNYTSSSDYSFEGPSVLAQTPDVAGSSLLENLNKDAKSVSGWLNLSLTPLERVQYGLASESPQSRGSLMAASQVPDPVKMVHKYVRRCADAVTHGGNTLQQHKTDATSGEPSNRSIDFGASANDQSACGSNEDGQLAPDKEYQPAEEAGTEGAGILTLLAKLPSLLASTFSPAPKGGDASHRSAHENKRSTQAAEVSPQLSYTMNSQSDAKDMERLPRKGEVVFIDGYEIQRPLRGQLFLDGEELLVPDPAIALLKCR